MTSDQHGPYVLGHTRATMAGTMSSKPVRGSESHQSRSQFGLKAAIRLHEVGIASKRESDMSR